MGRELVTRACIDVWSRPDLSHPARVVLVRMCLQAKDTDPEPVYFAGWQPLAMALGYPDISSGGAGERAVSRAINELTKAALVSADPRKPRSHKRRYRLTLPGS